MQYIYIHSIDNNEPYEDNIVEERLFFTYEDAYNDACLCIIQNIQEGVSSYYPPTHSIYRVDVKTQQRTLLDRYNYKVEEDEEGECHNFGWEHAIDKYNNFTLPKSWKELPIGKDYPTWMIEEVISYRNEKLLQERQDEIDGYKEFCLKTRSDYAKARMNELWQVQMDGNLTFTDHIRISEKINRLNKFVID